ncbi:MAG: MBL fold metallo-hydrolase [Phycisphaerae bacterium]|nr:MBL fold metallo-hydrolase [Phycisphaerae bacterium]
MVKGLSITVLVENTANRGGLLAEHGLAFWVEVNDRCILFDSGQGMALTHNAAKLGIDLSTATEVALSHGHYDHTGGLSVAMPAFNRTTVYAHMAAFCDRFVKESDDGFRSVGSPIESFDWLGKHVCRVVPTRMHPVELSEGVWLTGQIPRQNDFEDVGGAFYLNSACTEPDAIVDDQALFVQTGNGVVVLLGCAHAGVINTVDYIGRLAGNSRIHAVLGGMHLLHANERRLNQTVQRLRDLDVQRIGLAHCTGFGPMARLYHEFPYRCFHCVTGMRIEFD